MTRSTSPPRRAAARPASARRWSCPRPGVAVTRKSVGAAGLVLGRAPRPARRAAVLLVPTVLPASSCCVGGHTVPSPTPQTPSCGIGVSRGPTEVSAGAGLVGPASGRNMPRIDQPRSGKPAASATRAEPTLSARAGRSRPCPRRRHARAACATSRRREPATARCLVGDDGELVAVLVVLLDADAGDVGVVLERDEHLAAEGVSHGGTRASSTGSQMPASGRSARG